MIYPGDGSGTYNQQDATNSQSLLLAVLYMFRAFFAHLQEPGTLCAAIWWCYIAVTFVFTVRYDLRIWVVYYRIVHTDTDRSTW
jgi:hypothetical protein